MSDQHIAKLIDKDKKIADQLERLSTLDTFGNVKIISVKYAEFTGTQSNSTATGANFAITDLSIAHAMAKSTNKLLLLGQVGLIASSTQYAQAGIGLAAGGTLIGVGDAASSRTPVGAGGTAAAALSLAAHGNFVTMVYLPASTNLVTYTLNGINGSPVTRTIYINRHESDTDDAARQRSASYLILIELEG